MSASRAHHIRALAAVLVGGRLCSAVSLASVDAGAGRFAVSLQAVAKAAFAVRVRVRVAGPIVDVGRAHALPPMELRTGRNVTATTHGLLDQGARSAFRLSQRVAKLFRALPQHCVVGII